jgi:D-alanyl-lipoteichoic acid acyltransferase DltB (MBOAT superfamily)
MDVGFHFLENFNYPMISRSITEFWRRWHIQPGHWFRDYLFIPLGGSRVKSVWRLLFNMFVVWSLTGLWHCASWNNIRLGHRLISCCWLRAADGPFEKAGQAPEGMLYAMIAVTTITVMIRATSLGYASGFIGVMYGVNASGFRTPPRRSTCGSTA